MLELQRDLSALLGQAAFFKGIGKLIGFANSHQELRLRNQFVRMHAMLFSGSSERSEVYVGRDVLLAGGFIRIGADRVLTKTLDRSAMSACKLLFAGITVINRDEESTLDLGGDAIHELLCSERRFDPLFVIVLWMY